MRTHCQLSIFHCISLFIFWLTGGDDHGRQRADRNPRGQRAQVHSQESNRPRSGPARGNRNRYNKIDKY